MPHRVATAVVVAVLLPLAAGCGLEEQVVSITESGLASEGATEFENVGVNLQDGLDCALTEKPGVTNDNGDPEYTIACTGTTVDGEDATLEGDTEQGSFVGSVAGTEVWEKDCIGSDC